MRSFFFLLILVTTVSCSQKIYIVRHAEKAAGVDPATMTSRNDPPLTEAGWERARDLRDRLRAAHIRHIFSTHTQRTVSTARPLQEAQSVLMIQYYTSRSDSLPGFAERLRALRKGNVLVVGHSNTIDDLANLLAGTTVVPGDLKDPEYDNLFLLKRTGDRYRFKREKFGKPSGD